MLGQIMYVTCMSVQVGVLHGGNAEVTSLALGTGPHRVLAAGYEDGSIRLWDIESHDCQVTLR